MKPTSSCIFLSTVVKSKRTKPFDAFLLLHSSFAAAYCGLYLIRNVNICNCKCFAIWNVCHCIWCPIQEQTYRPKNQSKTVTIVYLHRKTRPCQSVSFFSFSILRKCLKDWKRKRMDIFQFDNSKSNVSIPADISNAKKRTQIYDKLKFSSVHLVFIYK